MDANVTSEQRNSAESERKRRRHAQRKTAAELYKLPSLLVYDQGALDRHRGEQLLAQSFLSEKCSLRRKARAY
ncbi:hypothetical protein PHMEG_0004730 [Phytophthora megakarya]|uniref:Uncharacterized protein n=1 Tax=Phytophthora megakarya TaxID=4795 RepID=A0A225WUQ0_9STRA|nr:hypothetical protein PHMEG_0004730 [Phytophthora megakarya]